MYWLDFRIGRFDIDFGVFVVCRIKCVVVLFDGFVLAVGFMFVLLC